MGELNLGHTEASGTSLDAQQIARWGLKQLRHIADRKEGRQAATALYKLMRQMARLATHQEGIEFATLFSRLTYLKSLYQLSGRLIYAAQHFRRLVEQEQWDPIDRTVTLGLWVNAHLIKELWHLEIAPAEFGLPSSLDELLPPKRKVKSYKHLMRGLITGPGKEPFTLMFLEEEDALQEQCILYHEADRNEAFSQNIKDLIAQGKFPFYVHLWRVEIDREGVLHPMAFVFEPDFLVDVTAIASSFDFKGVNFYAYILNKIVPSDKSVHLLKGNVANHILDRLVHRSDLAFRDIFKETFHQYPLDYALISEEEMKQLYEDAQLFFQVIRKVVKEDLKRLGIDTDQCAVEPSFYRPEFGIQGRLDLLHISADRKLNHIIELKSGSIFRPNKYGLNQSHYIQTLLYDLLVQGAMPADSETLSYILYCKDYDRPLRNAPVALASQIDALQVRNRIILFERFCAGLTADPKHAQFFKSLRSRKITLKGFLLRDLNRFEKVFAALDALEQAYYIGFFGFLVREHHLAKIGLEGSERRAGMSAIWRDAFRQKEDRFSLMHDLHLKKCSLDRDYTLTFQRGAATDPLANFRVGDIVILYPQDQLSQPTGGQIFKGSLVHMDEREIILRLRNAQPEETAFELETQWCLEHDMFDSSFRASFHNLFHWASLPHDKRALFLGRKSPAIEEMDLPHLPKGLTKQQSEIILQMQKAKDYFLLWGPPGTGKTSVMLKSYVQAAIREGKQRLMLLAYTNKAVDEICHTLDRIRQEDPFEYIRIGSRFSTSEQFKDRLLQEKVQTVEDRSSLRDMLARHKVYVATVASYNGKRDLLSLIHFDQVIIDEASQLLEPMMGSMMLDFPKMILIGDHRQLPAVVQQDPHLTKVDHKGLNELGLYSYGNSLFERLYRLAVSKKWNHAFAQLTYQGRMHQDIMKLPAEAFYSGNLFVLPPTIDPAQLQKADIEWAERPKELVYNVGLHRMEFLPTEVTEDEQLHKTNKDEAEKVVQVIKDYHLLWKANGKEWTEETLGVITPFRAQIAQIRKLLWALNEDWAAQVSIDTVERFQGGARDIIIMSLCVNSVHQWGAVVSPNDEGVDRKLNVALTRARSFFVWMGHEETIQKQPLYERLLKECHLLKESDVQ